MDADASIVVGRRGSLWSYGLVAAGTAALANLVILVVGAALGVQFEVLAFGQPGTQTITALPVVLSTVVSIALGTAAAAALGPRFRNGFGRAQILAGILTVLSLVAPIYAAQGATVGWLSAMHLVAGVAFILALQRAKEGGAA
jgi:hypothetical protein